MAVRIYGPNQTAGVLVTTTGKGSLNGNGLEAYAPVVAAANSSGDVVDLATEETLGDVLGELQTAATYLPPEPVVAASDATLTRSVVAPITTATTTALVTGISNQYIRVHRLVLTVSGTNTLTFKSNTTSLGTFTFPSTGGSLVFDFSSYPWLKTAITVTLNLTTSGTSTVEGFLDYVQSA